MNLVKSIFWYLIKEFLAIVLFIPSLIYLKVKYRNNKVLVVLNYHNFSKYNNYKIFRGNILKTGYSKNFERQIRFLKFNFNFVYPDEFFNDQCEKGINVLITFDDGYKDNFDLAFPILHKYRAKCVFFVVTDYIGTKKWLWHDEVRYLITKGKIEKLKAEHILKQMNSGIDVPESFIKKIDSLIKNENLPSFMMNWKNLKEIQNNGLRIGAHTVNHKILSFLKNYEQEEEINLSINRVDKELGIRSNEFAYPNGLFNENTLNIIKNKRLGYAFTTINGLNEQTQNKLEIKRIGINSSDSIFILLLKIFSNS